MKEKNSRKISLDELKKRYPGEYQIIQEKGDGDFSCLGKMTIEEAIKIPNVIIVHKTLDAPMETVYRNLPLIDDQHCAIVTNPVCAEALNKMMEPHNQKVMDFFSNFNNSGEK